MRKHSRTKGTSNHKNDLKFKKFQGEIGIYFNDEKLLKQAFTHSSYVNEHRQKAL